MRKIFKNPEYDAFIALFTALGQKEIKLQGLEGCVEGANPAGLAQSAASAHVRDTVGKFLVSCHPHAEPLRAEHPLYSFQDDGTRLSVVGSSGNEITSFAAGLTVAGHPTIVDVRISEWRDVMSSYFQAEYWDRKVPLDDTFGEKKYFRILALPSDQVRIDHWDGVDIVPLAFTREQLLRSAYEQLRSRQ